MKNNTILRVFALTLSVLMSLSLFSVGAFAADADWKTVYDDDHCDVFYKDGVFTFEVDAKEIGEILTRHEFDKTALAKLLPEEIYDLLEGRSKAAVVTFLSDLAAKEVLTYEELLALFDNKEEVLNKYFDLDFVDSLIGLENIFTEDLFDDLMDSGALDEVLANDKLRAELLTVQVVDELLGDNSNALEELLTEEILALLFENGDIDETFIKDLNDAGYLENIVSKDDLIGLLDDDDKAKLGVDSTIDDVLDLILSEKYFAELQGLVKLDTVFATVPASFMYGYIDVGELMNEVDSDELIDAVGGYDAVIAAVGGYDAVIDTIVDLELTDLVSVSDVMEYVDLAEVIKNAGDSLSVSYLRGVAANVFFSEVNEMTLNGKSIYDGEDCELDHNAFQTVVLQALPSVEDVTTIKDGDELLSLIFETEGDEVDFTFGVKVVLVGDCSTVNAYATKLVNIVTYTVEDSGTVNVDFMFDERFTGIYSDILASDQLTEARKLELLSMYGLDGEALVEELKKESLDEVEILAGIAKARLGDLVEEFRAKFEKLREYVVKAAEKSATVEGLTSLADCYEGNGVFFLNVHEEMTVQGFANRVSSRFESLPEGWVDYLKQDAHVEDINVTVTVEDFFRVSYHDTEGNTLFTTFLPAGESLELLKGATALAGHGENGWYDKEGKTYTEMPSKDVDLYEHVHEYGDWKSDGDNTHSRECVLGDSVETEPHTWDGGKVTTPATHTTDGVKTYTCTVCGETRTEVIHKDDGAHDFSGAWKYDDEKHWKECTCGEKSDEGKHVYDDDKDTTCNVCGYTRQLPPPGGSSYTWAIVAGVSFVTMAGCAVFFVKRKKSKV